MTLEQKLRHLNRESRQSGIRDRDRELERTLEYLRRLSVPPAPRKLPAQRAPKGIEEYVEGEIRENAFGQFFQATQMFPFGRPYGKLRLGEIATADLSPLNVFLAAEDSRRIEEGRRQKAEGRKQNGFGERSGSAEGFAESKIQNRKPKIAEGRSQSKIQNLKSRIAEGGSQSAIGNQQSAILAPSRLVFLDTETTGLAGGTGTCAFLIGIGSVEGVRFSVRQFFLRDYPEEKAQLQALSDALAPYEGLVTFNGKTFDIPLLETRYALARMKSPFKRMLHLDALHPARRLWKLRLESCKLTDLESALLGIHREGDVPGSEIPGIFFDYLRSGDAQGLQPVFHHNALDILTLAALTVELARALADPAGAGLESPLDLFSLSRILGATGSGEQSVAVCQQALATGLPPSVESQALRHLALQLKRQRRNELAAEAWLELTRREVPLAIVACEELAIYYEHRRRDSKTALEFTAAALERLREESPSHPHLPRFIHRLARLEKKLSRALKAAPLPLSPAPT
jgi:hypothetical protein